MGELGLVPGPLTARSTRVHTTDAKERGKRIVTKKCAQRHPPCLIQDERLLQESPDGVRRLRPVAQPLLDLWCVEVGLLGVGVVPAEVLEGGGRQLLP